MDKQAEFGKPVVLGGHQKPPTYEEALSVLLQVEKLLRANGPGANKRKAKAMELLGAYNNYEVWSSNILNPEGGLFPISARSFGSFMDPSSESYHSM